MSFRIGKVAIDLAPLEHLIDGALRSTIPSTGYSLLMVLHAVRLSVLYFHATAPPAASGAHGGRPSWLQGLVSVLMIPIAGAVATTLLGLSQGPPGWLVSDQVVPIYAGVYLALHVLAPLRDFVLSVPLWLIEAVTLPADLVLKGVNLCDGGVELALAHRQLKYNAAVAATVAGGIIGTAGYACIACLGVFQRQWQLRCPGATTPVGKGVEWDWYGPFVLSLLYIALRGIDRDLNDIVAKLTLGKLRAGWVYGKYLNKSQARAVVTTLQTILLGGRSLGTWDLRLPTKLAFSMPKLSFGVPKLGQKQAAPPGLPAKHGVYQVKKQQ